MNAGGISEEGRLLAEKNREEYAKKNKAVEANRNLGKDVATNDGTPKSSAPLRYPYTKIDEHDDYLRLEIVEFTPPGLQRADDSLRLRTSDEIAKKDINHTIMLPVPQGVEDGRSADWDMSEMGPLAALSAAAAGAGLRADGSLATMGGASFAEMKGQLDKALETDKGTVGKLLTGGIAGLVANAVTGGKGGDAVARETGLRINKNQQLLFAGVTGRDFNFGWDIIPRSKKEASQVKVIIRVLKQAMSAQRGGTNTVKGLFLKSPDIFYLTYMKGKNQHPFLNAFKPAALTSCNVNYTGSGTYATYHDGNPVHLNLSLTFRELTPVYREDYSTEQSGEGVGY